MFLFVFFFFANSIFLTKQIDLKNKKKNFATSSTTAAGSKKTDRPFEKKKEDHENGKIPF